jgi:hypothetical protein
LVIGLRVSGRDYCDWIVGEKEKNDIIIVIRWEDLWRSTFESGSVIEDIGQLQNNRLRIWDFGVCGH